MTIVTHIGRITPVSSASSIRTRQHAYEEPLPALDSGRRWRRIEGSRCSRAGHPAGCAGFLAPGFGTFLFALLVADGLYGGYVLLGALIVLPFIVGYTVLSCRVFRGKTTEKR